MRPELALRRCLALLLLGGFAAGAGAGIKVNVNGVEGDARRNVLAYLSVERYRERSDVDDDTVRRLFNRIDGEVKNALRPFGYYEPTVTSDYRADGRDWQIDVGITPGEPVRIRALSVTVEGPGAADPAFDSIRNQTTLRTGMRLNHGSYEQVKGELLRIAASNGYLAAKLLRHDMPVDVEKHSASVDLALDTGPRYRFGRIDIEQKFIRPGLMQRFLRFREGDFYSATELLRTQFALDDSLYFSAVDVEPGDPDAATLTVPVRISATRSKPVLSIGGGYGTDTGLRGTLGWTDPRINDRGHRLRFELKASATTRRIDSRYDIPIGDPALERFSIEGLNRFEELSDLDTNETTLRPSITRVTKNWQIVTSLSATRTTTQPLGEAKFSSDLLVPGIVLASVPDGFLGESLFSRGFYAELIGSHSALGSDADFLRLLVQAERGIDLDYQWHVKFRGEIGASLVSNFSSLPGIYRFFAGGDRSVRGFAYNSLSPDETGGKHLLVGSVELVRDLPLNLAIATFFDVGNAFNKFSDPLEYAAGVGVRYRLPVVSIGLDLAKPISQNGPIRLHLNISPKL
jgi:translocation and assembly module TamA